MFESKLKVNDGKTEYMLIRTRQLPKVHFTHISVREKRITPSLNLKNLGAVMDTSLTFRTQINKVRKTFFYFLYNI